MAAEAQRATRSREQTNFAPPPRMPAHRSSLAHTATDPNADRELMATAWVEVWNDCGGRLIADTDGNRFVIWPDDSRELLASPFDAWTNDELRGARRAMLLMLTAAGRDAIGTAFTVLSTEA